MVVAFDRQTLRRLEEIEAAEGIAPVDLIHQAVDVFSRLDADGRRILGIAAIQLVVERLTGGRHDG